MDWFIAGMVIVNVGIFAVSVFIVGTAKTVGVSSSKVPNEDV